jgi:hypothetical protein
MKTVSQLGIYMDHSTALFLELKDDAILHNSISSDFTHEEKEIALNKSEKLMHNKENHEQSHFYKQISDTIRNFQEVLLFGPTEAKSELFNLLKTNHLFDAIKIEVKGSDKMEQSQMDTFVRNYFN